jgi:dCMP deaminase
MMRPDRDDTLMMVALTYEQRSTCDRNHVGAVISIDGRIIVTGYNGAPAGMPHCTHEDMTLYLPGHEPLPRRDTGCKVAVHAEANAIAFAAKHGLRVDGATLHTTLSPCYACSQFIINAGLVRVVFNRPYRDPSGIDLLREAGITVEQADE